MTLTKSDIDGLVEAMPQCNGDVVFDWEGCTSYIPPEDVRAALYLAAGLTAEGERKPARVRCWLVYDHHGRRCAIWTDKGTAESTLGAGYRIAAGWFISDGAE